MIKVYNSFSLDSTSPWNFVTLPCERTIRSGSENSPFSIGLLYDIQSIEFAAYMHDWGAFPAYIQKDVEHAVRSRQVVEAEVVPQLDLTTEQEEVLLEFLGMLGMAREFARGPKNVETCYKRILS